MKHFLSRYCQTHISDVLFNIKKTTLFCSLCFPWLKAEPSLQKRSCADTPQQIHFLLTEQYVSISQTACRVQHFIIAFSNLLGYISNGMLSLDLNDALNKSPGHNRVRGS